MCTSWPTPTSANIGRWTDVEWRWLILGLILGVGGTLGGLSLLRRPAASSSPPVRWSAVLVPTLVGAGLKQAVPRTAIAAALALVPTGRVVFYVFTEVPRSHSLSAQLRDETNMCLELIEAAEDEARSYGRTVESGIQYVRDYGYGVVELARQLGVKAVVLESRFTPKDPNQRGELGSSVHQPSISTLMSLIHERAGCDVLIAR